MKTFKDSTGRTWNLSITVDAVKRLRAEMNIDLCELHTGDDPPIFRLERDVPLLFDVIWRLVAPKPEGMTAEQFAALIGAEEVGPAVNAFWEDLSDFFQSLRPMIREMIATVRNPSLEVSGGASGNSPESQASTPAP